MLLTWSSLILILLLLLISLSSHATRAKNKKLLFLPIVVHVACQTSGSFLRMYPCAPTSLGAPIDHSQKYIKTLFKKFKKNTDG